MSLSRSDSAAIRSRRFRGSRSTVNRLWALCLASVLMVPLTPSIALAGHHSWAVDIGYTSGGNCLKSGGTYGPWYYLGGPAQYWRTNTDGTSVSGCQVWTYRTINQIVSTASWYMNVASNLNGTYHLYPWMTCAGAMTTTNARYRVYPNGTGGGAHYHSVNQQAHCSQYAFLATRAMTATQGGYVQLTDWTSESGSTKVGADFFFYQPAAH